MIKSFKDLIVWQKSIELVEEIYRKTSKLPKSEVFGLVSQMRRSAISIPSNIAEGKSRKTKNDYIHFLRIALSSSTELETQIIICEKVYQYDDLNDAGDLLIEVQKMLTILIRKLDN